MSDEFETRPGGAKGEATMATGGDAWPGRTGGSVVDDPDEGEPGELGDDDLLAGAGAGAGFGTGAAAGNQGPAWVWPVTGAALGLVVVQALVLIGTFAQGMAVARFQGDFFHKIGVALLSNVGSANGLTLLVAAVLAGLPAIVGVPVGEGARRRQALVFGFGALLAILLILGTPLAVRARIRVLDVGGQAVDGLARRVLATYVAGTLGTALVALAACLGLSRLSRSVTPRP